MPDSAGVGPGGSASAGPGGDVTPLWRDRNFVTFWSGQTLSQFGAQVSALALPTIAVLLLHAGEFQVGVLKAAGVAAFLLVGLPAGAWIDRMRKRRVMIAADAVRALTLLVVPILWWTGALGIWALCVVALIIGTATVFFDVSYQSVIPALVPREQIPDANGKLESTNQLSEVGGPAIAGWLIGIVSAPIAILATVATYLASFVALNLTRDSEPPRTPGEQVPLRTAVSEGLAWVLGNGLLRRIVATTAISNLFGTVASTLMPILLLRTLGFSVRTMGLLSSLASLGALAGALTSTRAMARIGPTRAIPIGAILFCAPTLLVPLAAGMPRAQAFVVLAVEGIVAGYGALLYNISQISLRQQITPHALLGRMNASIRFFVWGVLPVGSVVAGAVAAWIGLVPTLWIGAAGGLFSALPVILGPFWAKAPATR